MMFKPDSRVSRPSHCRNLQWMYRHTKYLTEGRPFHLPSKYTCCCGRTSEASRSMKSSGIQLLPGSHSDRDGRSRPPYLQLRLSTLARESHLPSIIRTVYLSDLTYWDWARWVRFHRALENSLHRARPRFLKLGLALAKKRS